MPYFDMQYLLILEDSNLRKLESSQSDFFIATLAIQ